MLGLFRSLVDPLVQAALVRLAGSIVVSLLTSDHTFDRDQSRCTRAFAFLQDEAVNPMLEKDDVFYRSQLAIAQRCNLAKD
jgi:indole-3-glycerol phosphate synthase